MDATICLTPRKGNPAALGDGRSQLLHRAGMRIDADEAERNADWLCDRSVDGVRHTEDPRLGRFDVYHAVVRRRPSEALILNVGQRVMSAGNEGGSVVDRRGVRECEAAGAIQQKKSNDRRDAANVEQ